MSLEPTHLRLEEAFDKSGSNDRDAFLRDMRERLAAGLAEAIGWPNGPLEDHRPPGACEPRQSIKTEQWRDLVLCFEMGGCAAPAENTEHALGGAWARRTGHSGVKPFGRDTPPVVWLDLLICTKGQQLKTQDAATQQLLGRYSSDQALIDEMKSLMDDDKDLSIWGATDLVADRAKGTIVRDNRRKRLEIKFKSKFG